MNRIKNISNSFSKNETPIIIICEKENIEEIFNEINDSVDFNSVGGYEFKDETIAQKLNISQCFYEGKHFVFVPEESKHKFFEFMHLMNK